MKIKRLIAAGLVAVCLTGCGTTAAPTESESPIATDESGRTIIRVIQEEEVFQTEETEVSETLSSETLQTETSTEETLSEVQEVRLDGEDVPNRSSIAYEDYDFDGVVYNEPCALTNADLENEFYTLNGQVLSWPLPHKDYEMIPYLTNSDIYLEFTPFFCEEVHYDGQDIILEGHITAQDDINDTSDISVRLTGVTCYNLEERPNIEQAIQNYITHTMNIQPNTMLRLEYAENSENPDGTYNGYVWTGNILPEGLLQLQEYLLLNGVVEPSLDEENTKYNNWYIQYPALYR